MTDIEDIRILVAIDFGTTYSGFAYVHKQNSERVFVNTSWPWGEGGSKAPTALQYDERYRRVINWGKLALEEEPDEILDDTKNQCSRPVELFKLHLSNLPKKDKPWLPPQLSCKRAIKDYLTQMGKLIKETLERGFPTIIFPQQVEFVLTIPAEWPPNTPKIMRECAYEAGLLTSSNSKLKITTEPEAAALHCLSVVKEHDLQPSDSFVVADCGGGTVDLTTRKLLPENKLSEITERIGDLCGSTFVDKNFLRWLGGKVGFQALEDLKSNHYGQLQHLVQRFFCTRIKFKFNGELAEYRTLKLNLQQYCPDLPQYVTSEFEEQMEEAGWVLKIDFDSVKKMFDPVIDRIIKQIGDQLNNSSDEKCSAMFLVGGFSKSPYLLRRVKETFRYQVPIIAAPPLPEEAIIRGAVTYGLNPDVIPDRMLKWTFGIELCRKWVDGKDEIRRRTVDGKISYFYKLARRGTNIKVDQKFWEECRPLRSNQNFVSFNVYYTSRHDPKFCDEPGMKLLGKLKFETNGTHLIEFSLTFGKVEIKAIAKSGDIHTEANFELDI